MENVSNKYPTLDYLYKNVERISLAHWIMNYGYWDGTVIFCTESFTQTEIKRLMEQLHLKFGMKTGTKKRHDRTEIMGGHRLQVRCYSLQKLFDLVSPHMHECIMYKFGTF